LHIGSLLDGIEPLPAVAKAIGVTSSTLKRWCDKPGGPPLIYVGRKPHLDLAKFRQWLESRERVVSPPTPRRGRPPGAKDKQLRARHAAERP